MSLTQVSDIRRIQKSRKRDRRPPTGTSGRWGDRPDVSICGTLGVLTLLGGVVITTSLGPTAATLAASRTVVVASKGLTFIVRGTRVVILFLLLWSFRLIRRLIRLGRRLKFGDRL